MSDNYSTKNNCYVVSWALATSKTEWGQDGYVFLDARAAYNRAKELNTRKSGIRMKPFSKVEEAFRTSDTVNLYQDGNIIVYLDKKIVVE